MSHFGLTVSDFKVLLFGQSLQVRLLIVEHAALRMCSNKTRSNCYACCIKELVFKPRTCDAAADVGQTIESKAAYFGKGNSDGGTLRRGRCDRDSTVAR